MAVERRPLKLLRAPGQADRERQAEEYILRHVREHPGVNAQDVIRDRTSGISRKLAEETIKRLLYRKPKRLRSEHPEGTHAFGRGLARLWVIDAPEPSS